MNDKQRKTLDAISSISEKYIDEATVERIKYINDMEKRGFFGRHKRIISLAASVFILISSLITVLLILFTNHVPVYEGMTVSSEAPVINAKRSSVSSFYSLSPAKATALAAEFEEKTALDSLLTERYGVAEGKYEYYAKKNEDVYITVHIDNPSGYEILSFTLNGVKYSSYMFEDGSDLENLILKVNVGDAEGFASYTIDAIKYVDGEEVKDVKMEGEKTVNIGIAKSVGVTSDASVTSIKADGIELEVDVYDDAGMLSISSGRIYAIIYDGSKISAEKEISVGENIAVSFDGLSTNAAYKYAIIAVYDAFDGDGIRAHVLSSSTVSLDSGIYAKDVRMTQDRLTFTLWSPNSFSTVTEVSLLNSQGNTVKTAAASDGEVVFSGLTAGEYSVVISYSYDVSDRSVNDSSTAISGITCLVGAKPILAGEVYRSYSETPIWQPSLSAWGEHYGVDIKLKPTDSDASVHAVARGVVSKVAEEQPYFGKYVIITDSFGYSYYYCSLAEIYVKEGDTVTLGDVIGTAGDTMATECVDDVHLHLALKGPDGEYVNPGLN